MNSAPVNPVSLRRSAARGLVRGQVQGVGFRPFIYRLAQACNLSGCVGNVSAGVQIEIEGIETDVARFRDKVLLDLPSGARIDSLVWETMDPPGRAAFLIDSTDNGGPLLARVPRDRASCAACRTEIFDPLNRRHGYPFTNCTACGPRYSILAQMPYDRPATAMASFHLCRECEREYRDPDDRRFHAEPNACAVCGPTVAFRDADGQRMAESLRAVDAAIGLLQRGAIVALKGLGGFQLLTPADDAAAIARLRQRKQRPRKPLAVMVRNLDAAESLAFLDDTERRLLTSAENPIVLLKCRKSALADNIAPDLATVGLFLPTTPLHHLLLTRLDRPLVVTSGNRSDEPIAIDETDAIDSLKGIADGYLVHDRKVIHRLDDSVVRAIESEPTVLRLSRGYAPLPLPAIEVIARRASLPPILATGGHLKGASAIWTGEQAILGPHIGDLDSPATRQAFVESVRELARFYRCEPATIACDLHPDYFTTRWAEAQPLPRIGVQHHHAHALACMAENQILDREVLALTWDGTGFGTHRTIWGGEALKVAGGSFERVASLLPFALPGGEAAIRHPNRIAFALLWQLPGEKALRDWPRRLQLATDEVSLLETIIARRTNSPSTSSIGRLFDGVAALVLGYHRATYEGEAAIALESIADDRVCDYYPLPLDDSKDELPRGDWRPMLQSIVHDIEKNIAPGVIAAKFHNALANWAVAIVSRHSLRDVVLSGGCFQNRLLAERVSAMLSQAGRLVYRHREIPPGDGGLAAGQLAAAVLRMAND